MSPYGIKTINSNCILWGRPASYLQRKCSHANIPPLWQTPTHSTTDHLSKLATCVRDPALKMKPASAGGMFKQHSFHNQNMGFLKKVNLVF